MAEKAELLEMSHSHHYHISIKAVTWVSALVIVLMTLLYPMVNFPPTFGSYSSDLFFHSIGLSMVALVSCLILLVYNLQWHEPTIDFPIHYRALLTTIFAAISGIFFSTPALSSIPQLPTLFFVLAALFAIDITGALFIELLFLPRKLGGSYDLSKLSKKPFPKRYINMFMYKRADVQTYKQVNAAYWLVLVGLGSLFIGEVAGFLLLWFMTFGVSFLGIYVQYLGGLDTTTGAILAPHSHGVAVAIMAILIGLVVQHFRTLDLKGWKRGLTRVGVWLSILSLIVLTLMYVAGIAVNYAPPTFFQSGPNGVNGMAGDDAFIALVLFGAVLAFVPLALTRFRGKASSHDPVRLAILFILLMWTVANAAAGFFIEFNQTSFQNSLLANDQAYSQFQPMFGIFFLTVIVMTLLAADYYAEGARERKAIGWLALLGTIIATAGGLAWVFINPSTSSPYFLAYIGGILVMCLSMLLTVVSVYRTKIKIVKVARK